jgi:hypothetical protein
MQEEKVYELRAKVARAKRALRVLELELELEELRLEEEEESR